MMLGVLTLLGLLMVAYLAIRYLHVVVGILIIWWILSAIFGSFWNMLVFAVVFFLFVKFILYLNDTGKGRTIWRKITLRGSTRRD